MTPESRKTIDDATHEEWVAASRNMKMEISKEWAEKSAKIEGDAAVGAGLPSALGLPKLAAPLGALALATGSNPVSPEKFLAILIGDTKYRIETYRREQDACRDAKLFAQSSWAEGYADAEEKTLLMLETLYDRLGFSTERQPESNTEMSRRSGERGSNT